MQRLGWVRLGAEGLRGSGRSGTAQIVDGGTAARLGTAGEGCACIYSAPAANEQAHTQGFATVNCQLSVVSRPHSYSPPLRNATHPPTHSPHTVQASHPPPHQQPAGAQTPPGPPSATPAPRLKPSSQMPSGVSQLAGLSPHCSRHARVMPGRGLIAVRPAAMAGSTARDGCDGWAATAWRLRQLMDAKSKEFVIEELKREFACNKCGLYPLSAHCLGRVSLHKKAKQHPHYKAAPTIKHLLWPHLAAAAQWLSNSSSSSARHSTGCTCRRSSSSSAAGSSSASR